MWHLLAPLLSPPPTATPAMQGHPRAATAPNCWLTPWFQPKITPTRPYCSQTTASFLLSPQALNCSSLYARPFVANTTTLAAVTTFDNIYSFRKNHRTTTFTVKSLGRQPWPLTCVWLRLQPPPLSSSATRWYMKRYHYVATITNFTTVSLYVSFEIRSSCCELSKLYHFW